jgi:uncharacterized protein YndB with AHSA1/START domain
MLAAAIGAEVRGCVEREHEGGPARVVIAERVYDTTPEDLWDALTRRERIPRWFMPVEGELKLGGRYQLIGNAGGAITRCDPPTALDVTWEFGGTIAWVTLRLAAEGEGTRLTLEHIVRASDVDAHWNTYGPAAVGVGWDLSIRALGQHIATGEAVDPTAAEAWSMSEAGKAFIRASAEGWAAAHILGGENADTALAMARRTASFYTGE